MKIAIAKKIGMSRIFDKDGKIIAVSLLSIIPSEISKINTTEKDGHDSVQISAKKDSKITKKTEFPIYEDIKPKIGDSVDIEEFVAGDEVYVIGKSKGKGFSGAIKKHGFSRGPKTHGSDHHRKTGSIGSMYPQHVVKGRKMPGKIVPHNTTEKNLKIVDVDPKTNIIAVSGSIPGPKKSIIKLFVK